MGLVDWCRIAKFPHLMAPYMDLDAHLKPPTAYMNIVLRKVLLNCQSAKAANPKHCCVGL